MPCRFGYAQPHLSFSRVGNAALFDAEIGACRFTFGPGVQASTLFAHPNEGGIRLTIEVVGNDMGIPASE
jgi:hypothetical protein